MNTRQILDLKRLFEDATLVEALDAACRDEATQWLDRLLSEAQNESVDGPNRYLMSRYAQRAQAYREMVGKLREIAKRVVK